MLIHEPLFRAAAGRGDQVAIVCDNQPLTYRELAGAVAEIAGRVRAAVRPGDRVVVLLDDKPRHLAAIYAVAAARAIAVPLSESAGDLTRAEIVDHCRPAAAITGSTHAAAFEAAGIPVLLLGGLRSGAEFPGSSGGPFVPRDDAPALILYTSGTTSKHKGVLLSHRNLVQATRNINEFMRVDDTIREYVSVPMTHSFGFGRARCVLSVGGTLVLQNGHFNPAGMVHHLSRHACNAASWVPAGFTMAVGRFERELRAIGRQVRWIELGSAPMSADQKRLVAEIFPDARICLHYGLTEASRSTFLEFREDAHKLDSVGKPSPNVEIGILGESGGTPGDGLTGEIGIRGDHVMLGYWQDDALSARTRGEQGFLRTGDYGFLDPEGYLHLLGRQDDLINMGGIKVSPLEVEAAIRAVAPGLDCCVIGIPDPEGVVGSLPALCYVGAGEDVRLSRLHAGLAGRLDRVKFPRVAYRLREIPRTENGKVRRREVVDRLASLLASEPEADAAMRAR